MLWFDIKLTPIHRHFSSIKLRCSWYQTMAAIVDESAQKRGVCGVTFGFGAGRGFLLPSMLGKVTELASRSGYVLNHCLPYRYTSYHVCIDDPRVASILSILRVYSGKETRLRIRSHFGKWPKKRLRDS
jgi:hypothetical protein